MYFLVKNECIDYEYYGGKNETIIFLHGWGGNKYSFQSTINLLISKYNILTLTLPTTEDTTSIWTLREYARVVNTLMQLHNIINPIVICHSFGFRVATIMKMIGIKFKKIIVTGGAGIRKNINFITKIMKNNRKILLKHKKYSFLFRKIASSDYFSLSSTNRETFKKIVNLNTRPYLKFNFPILLFWGKHDQSTPLQHAKYIKKINQCELIIVNSGHFAYLEENSLFNHKILEFLK